MRTPRRDVSRARNEAAAWFTRLSRRSVTTQALRDFREWRRTPTNRAEYQRIEDIWEASHQLSSDPEIAAARREALQRSDRRRSRRWRDGAGLALASVAITGALLLLVGFLNRPPVFESGVGEQRIVRLDDGTVMRLNTDSRAVVKLGDDARLVELERGQALFDVAHDTARPFTVQADGAKVTALGTRFDVRKHEEAIEVLLLEGSVEVKAPSGGPVTLRPNQRVTIRGNAIEAPAHANVPMLTSWTERRLTFQRTPLAAAVAEVNRYSEEKVKLEAEDLAAEPVSGVFETGDAKSFAAAVASVFDLRVVDAGGKGTLVLQRPGPPPSS